MLFSCYASHPCCFESGIRRKSIHVDGTTTQNRPGRRGLNSFAQPRNLRWGSSWGNRRPMWIVAWEDAVLPWLPRSNNHSSRTQALSNAIRHWYSQVVVTTCSYKNKIKQYKYPNITSCIMGFKPHQSSSIHKTAAPTVLGPGGSLMPLSRDKVLAKDTAARLSRPMSINGSLGKDPRAPETRWSAVFFWHLMVGATWYDCVPCLLSTCLLCL